MAENQTMRQRSDSRHLRDLPTDQLPRDALKMEQSRTKHPVMKGPSDLLLPLRDLPTNHLPSLGAQLPNIDLIDRHPQSRDTMRHIPDLTPHPR